MLECCGCVFVCLCVDWIGLDCYW